MEVRANALRRQARAAEKYKKLSDDIRIAEGRLIYARWRDAAEAADQARCDADAAEAAVKTAQDELETVSKAQTEVATRVAAARGEIGRASCRASVCMYVSTSEVAESLQIKNITSEDKACSEKTV